jgi:Lrp/AsnC family transcriptional regulator, leucine-responsive regulatory protein
MNLDIKNKKILQSLDLNPKISTSKLAKQVRLSQQVVDYRIKKLQNSQIIIQFGTIINLFKLGYEQYRLFFQLDNIIQKQKDELLGFLKTNDNVYWTALIGGKYDILTTIWVKDYTHCELFLDNLFKQFPKTLKDYQAQYITLHKFYNHKFLHNHPSINNNEITLNFSKSSSPIHLDNLDFAILKKIKANCRLSSLQIANACKTTYKTVQNRIKNLEKKEIINGYRIFLKSEEFNYKACLLLISFNSYGREIEKQLLKFANYSKNITQVLKLFGSFSLMFHLRVKNEIELQNTIIELRNKYPIIGNYEVIPIFKDISINHFPIFT